MAVGDQKYVYADFISPIANYPGAKANFYLGECLRNTYHAYQTDAQILVQQAWGSQSLNRYFWQVLSRNYQKDSVNPTKYLTHVLVWVKAGTTHITSKLLFNLNSETSSGKVYFQGGATISDGVNTDSPLAAEVKKPVSIEAIDSSQSWETARTRGTHPELEPGGQFEHIVDTPIVSVSTGQLCTIVYEISTDPSDVDWTRFTPRYLQITAEMRY